MDEPLDLEDIREAAERIRPYVHRTPVLTSMYFNRRLGAEVFFKCENFQKAGSFKARGACNAVFSLSEDEARKGVLTHSSGNHAQALALAAKKRGIRAFIVMPSSAPAVKVAAVKEYGAQVTLCEPTLEAREREAAAVAERTGATLVHPYRDRRVVAGQGTAALELLEDAGELDLVLAPVGGGGLLSGTAACVSGLSPRTKVIGVEPELADDAFRSLREGRIVPSNYPETVADGLRTSLAEITFAVIRRLASGIVTVSEAGIVDAMKQTWERMKIVVEPSGAVPLAALLESKLDAGGKRVGVILSGGNVDLDRLPWVR